MITANNSCMRLLFAIFMRFNLIYGIKLIEHLFTVLPKVHTFQNAKKHYCQYVTYHITFSIYAKHFF